MFIHQHAVACCVTLLWHAQKNKEYILRNKDGLTTEAKLPAGSYLRAKGLLYQG